MFRCTDPLADLLKSYGYNLVALPKPDIEPLQILEKNGRSLSRAGHIKDLFKRGDTLLPRSKRNIPIVKELQNKKSSGINAKIGVNILANFLKPMGDEQAVENAEKDNTLNTVFSDVDEFVFSYENVVSDTIEIIKLDQYIHDSELNEKARNFVEKLKDGKLYVITATLKSNAFSTEFVAKNQAGVEIGLPDIKKVVGGSVNVSKDSSQSNKIVYQGEKTLIFGFKAVRLLYDDKKDMYKIKSADGIVLRGEEDYPVEKLDIGQEAFAEI